MLVKSKLKKMREIAKRNIRYLRCIKRFPEHCDENGFVCIRQILNELLEEEFNALSKICRKKKVILSNEGSGMYKFKLKA